LDAAREREVRFRTQVQAKVMGTSQRIASPIIIG
jgi:hypothetical protein